MEVGCVKDHRYTSFVDKSLINVQGEWKMEIYRTKITLKLGHNITLMSMNQVEFLIFSQSC